MFIVPQTSKEAHVRKVAWLCRSRALGFGPTHRPTIETNLLQIFLRGSSGFLESRKGRWRQRNHQQQHSGLSEAGRKAQILLKNNHPSVFISTMALCHHWRFQVQPPNPVMTLHQSVHSPFLTRDSRIEILTLVNQGGSVLFTPLVNLNTCRMYYRLHTLMSQVRLNPIQSLLMMQILRKKVSQSATKLESFSSCLIRSIFANDLSVLPASLSRIRLRFE